MEKFLKEVKDKKSKAEVTGRILGVCRALYFYQISVLFRVNFVLFKGSKKLLLPFGIIT